MYNLGGSDDMKDNINKFLDYIAYERKYSDKTVKSYENDLFKLEKFLSKRGLNYLHLKYEDVSEFLIFLQKSGYKSGSINRMISGTRSFYNYLMLLDVTDDNPFMLVSNLKREKMLPTYFTYNDFEKMLDSVTLNDVLSVRNRLILELLLATGTRVSELANIKISDIDFKNNEIKIFGKGSKERVVFFGNHAREKMYYYLKDARPKLLDGKFSEFLFINDKGGKLTDRGVRFIIDNIMKKCQLKVKVTPHVFRHTFATMLLNEGCDVRSVQELLGHENLSTTSIYTHLTNETIRKTYLNAHPHGKC